MAINKKYLEYLKLFKKTQTLLDFKNHKGNGIALRHDVDHSLDAALEMACFENYYGFKSTYFLLPYAAYWNDERFFKKVSQIVNFGHEIGIHFNGISDWIELRTDDIYLDLKKITENFKKNNINISGLSSHGDSLCYKKNFINYWAFLNLKPSDPLISESGRSAEGLYDVSGENKSVLYPKSDLIEREDGKTFPFWSIDYTKLKLKYHAWHLQFDQYHSDSGGSWKRTSDPLKSDLSGKRIQILIHPEYWLAKTKVFFFLGTARSGSSWLTNILHNGSNIGVGARHEYLLNQDFFNKKSKFKNTHDVKELENNLSFVKRKFINFWEEFHLSNINYAEVNIYLENFISLLKNFFPDAKYIYIERKSHEVISSLKNRGWYKKYPDQKRPSLKLNLFKTIKFFIKHRIIIYDSQFMRILLYVLQVRNNLNNKCDYFIDMNKAFEDYRYLKEKLFKIGIYFYPLLAEGYDNRVNLNKQSNHPYFDNWTKDKRYIYNQIISNLSPFKLIAKQKNFFNVKKINIIFQSNNDFFTTLLIPKSVLNTTVFKIRIHLSLKMKSVNNRRIPVRLNEYTKKSFKSKCFSRNIFFVSTALKKYNHNVSLHPSSEFFSFSIPKQFIVEVSNLSCEVSLIGR